MMGANSESKKISKMQISWRADQGSLKLVGTAPRGARMLQLILFVML